MKRFIVIALLCLLCAGTRAQQMQDVIDAVIAALPAQNSSEFNSKMKDLAALAPQSVVRLGAMMRGASEGANAGYEYALSGLAVYASANPAVRDSVLKGFCQASQAQQDSVNAAFLRSQQRLLQSSPTDGFIAAPDIERSLSAAEVLRAMRSEDRRTRVQALNAAPTDAGFRSRLVKARHADGAESDILYWLGEHAALEQMPYILAALDGPYGADAQAAAAKIGGHDAAVALCAILSPSLAYFNGDFSSELMDAARGADPASLAGILELASRGHMTSFRELAYESGAYGTLEGMVALEDEPRLAALLDTAADADVPALSRAYTKAAGYFEDYYGVVMSRIVAAGSPCRFYTTLAATGTDAAAGYLQEMYYSGSSDSPAALAALAVIDNVGAVEPLLRASESDERYIPRVVDLLERSDKDWYARCDLYTRALALSRSAGVRNTVLSYFGSVGLPEALTQCDKYLDDAESAHEAALACRQIMSYCEDSLDADELKRVGLRAIKVLEATGWADDLYAATDIRGILDRH